MVSRGGTPFRAFTKSKFNMLNFYSHVNPRNPRVGVLYAERPGDEEPMAFTHIDTEIIDHTGWVWLNRPEKRNALSADMWDDLPRAVAELDTDPEVRVMVVAARGSAFTVGIDLEMLASLSPDADSEGLRNLRAYERIKELQGSFTAFAEARKPVIAAVHGYCLGAGMDLITACDIRLAAADAVFSIRETRMSLVADVGTLQRLPRIVGPGHVAELAYTGKDIGAGRAVEIGLVDHLHPDVESLHAAAADLAAEIAANSPIVVQGVKRILRAGTDLPLEAALDYVALWNAATIRTNDLDEAITAFFEKRPPRFTGT